MIINYKKPYWLKYKWELNDTNQDQFVTPFNKTISNDLCNLQFEDKFSVLCKFKIDNKSNKDVKAGIFGKSGQNFGLNFDYSIDSLVFEFRTLNKNKEIDFHCVIIDEVNSNMINDGVTICVIKNHGEFIFYCDSKVVKEYTFVDDPLIEDYRDAPFYLGCLNPGARDAKDRCYSEIDIQHLSIIKNNNSFDIAMEVIENQYYTLPTKSYYKNILGIYDFDMVNNYNIIYDNSKYSHFIELVPEEFVS